MTSCAKDIAFKILCFYPAHAVFSLLFVRAMARSPRAWLRDCWRRNPGRRSSHQIQRGRPRQRRLTLGFDDANPFSLRTCSGLHGVIVFYGCDHQCCSAGIELSPTSDLQFARATQPFSDRIHQRNPNHLWSVTKQKGRETRVFQRRLLSVDHAGDRSVEVKCANRTTFDFEKVEYSPDTVLIRQRSPNRSTVVLNAFAEGPPEGSFGCNGGCRQARRRHKDQ